ncbi:hypothetical protein B0H63DRAFT_200229 [Podospora didyma]|uniref:Chromo domain-containing protein n=1 Tax=Podospora didyma TaxID=330526 RepID=A0AAE0NH22_9PEZI|nr:hypothetical protein B0H63DRAFT_200229 [Podospora didyma]
MPPAFSDNEEGSDVEAPVAVKKSGREKKPIVYKEELPDDVDDTPTDDRNGDAAENDDEGEEEEDADDDDLPEEVYVVEKIISHMIDDEGKPRFEVKWEGYEKKSDRTWEPEENLKDNAYLALEEYFRAIGGREKLFVDTKEALKGKKRGRPSLGSGTPSSSGGGKRSKRNGDHPLDADPPLSARAAAWKPPPGSWEDHIAQLDACEDEETHQLMVYLTWKNGQKTQHPTSVIYARCPQKMLQFYERHVRIIKKDDGDGDSVTTPN